MERGNQVLRAYRGLVQYLTRENQELHDAIQQMHQITARYVLASQRKSHANTKSDDLVVNSSPRGLVGQQPLNPGPHAPMHSRRMDLSSSPGLPKTPGFGGFGGAASPRHSNAGFSASSKRMGLVGKQDEGFVVHAIYIDYKC